MIKSAIFEPNLLNMSPRSILILLPLFLFGLTTSAQYTEKINTNRPGTSQGAFSVGNNVLQLEGGMGFGKEKHKILNTKTNVFNFDYAVRYGLLIEQLELRLRGRFRADGVTQTIGANEEKIRRSNFEVNTLGAKYLIYDPYKRPKKDTINYEALKSWKEHHRFKWKTLIPAVSVYAGANFVASNNPFTFPEDPTFSPIFTIITQNNWTTSYGGDWGFVTNLIIDKITTDNPAIGWIFTATHTVNDTWAGFVELQGQKSDFYSDNILRLGGAYLFDQDLQFDANIAFNFKDTPSIFTFSFGASYRFDWHTKDEIIEKPGLEGGVKEKEEEEEEGEGEDGEGIEGELDELEEIENDSLKLRRKTPVINTFEDDSFRDEMERDLDERRTEERLERERIEQEKIDKKEGKKFKKEEARRLKREAKEAREAEKAAIKAEKEKQQMLQDIDAELDKMEKEQGVDGELDDLDKQLQELERMERELNEEEKQEEKEEKKAEEKQKEEEVDVDAEYEKYQLEQEKAKKEEEKRRKKEEKKRQKEERKRQKEAEKIKRNQEKDPNIDKEIDKELEDF